MQVRSPEPSSQPWRSGGVLPDMGEYGERLLGVPGYPLAMTRCYGQARRDRVVNRGCGRGQAAGERCNSSCVTEPDGGLGSQAPQRPGSVAGSAGAGLTGQPLFQVVGDARRAPVPSPAHRLVSVAEQAMGRHRSGTQAVVGSLAACACRRGTRAALGAVVPQFAQQRVDLRDGGVGKPFQDGGADELMEPQGVPGGVDERVCGE